MVEARTVGIIALVTGLLLGLGSVLLDYTGLSVTPDVLGTFQWVGVTAGSILFMLGLVILLYAQPAPKDV